MCRLYDDVRPERRASTWSNVGGKDLVKIAEDLWCAERPFMWNGIDVGEREIDEMASCGTWFMREEGGGGTEDEKDVQTCLTPRRRDQISRTTFSKSECRIRGLGSRLLLAAWYHDARQRVGGEAP